MTRTIRPLIAAAAAALASIAGAARAGTYQVSPVRIELPHVAGSALVEVRNTGPDALRFQVTAFAWTQSPDGQMELGPTKDVIFYPSLFSLAPGQRRGLRVAAPGSPAQVERTYRLVIEELPPLRAAAKGSGALQLQIRTRNVLPIFVAPGQPAAAMHIEGRGVSNGRYRVDVVNTGNVRFMLRKALVTGRAADGAVLFERDLVGWYVLSGGHRRFELDLPSESCRRLRAISIEVDSDAGRFGEVDHLPPSPCGP